MYLSKKVIATFCVCLLSMSNGYANVQDQKDNSLTMKLNTVSKNRLFTQTGLTRDQLIQKYLFSEIVVNDNSLLIQENSTFSSNKICNLSNYNKVASKPIKVWSSKEVVDNYRKLLLEGGIQLLDTDDIYSLSSSSQKQYCPTPFDTLYEINGSIVALTDEGYLLFFKNNDEKQSLKEPIDKNKYSLYGDTLFSNESIIEEVNKTCIFIEQVKNNEHTCILSNGKYDYSAFEEDNSFNEMSKIYLSKNNDINFFIKKTKLIDDSDVYTTEVTLFIEKNNQVKDKLVIYKSRIFPEATSVSSQFYFIDKNFDKVWLLATANSEGEGISALLWQEYMIDKSKGTFKLVKSKKCESGFNEQNNFISVCKNID